MCGPGVGTIGNVLGTGMQMNAATNQANYQAGIANQNAAIAQAQAVSAGQQGTNEQVQIRNKASQITGAQKTTLSANGLDIQAGTPLSILADTAQQSEQDVQTSRYNTAMQMWGLNNQANQYKSDAKNAIQAGKNSSNSALLSGITTAAKQYSAYKK
jgi:glutamate-1-semialdehyde aminotransferase